MFGTLECVYSHMHSGAQESRTGSLVVSSLHSFMVVKMGYESTYHFPSCEDFLKLLYDVLDKQAIAY